MENKELIFKEYHKLVYLYKLSKRELEKQQNKVEMILTKLTNTVSQLKDDVASKNNNLTDKMAKLIAEKVDLEETITYQQALVDSRLKRTNAKYDELKESTETYDIVYNLKYVNKFKISQVAKVIHYGRSQTYEYCSKVLAEMKRIEKEVNEQIKNDKLI